MASAALGASIACLAVVLRNTNGGIFRALFHWFRFSPYAPFVSVIVALYLNFRLFRSLHRILRNDLKGD